MSFTFTKINKKLLFFSLVFLFIFQTISSAKVIKDLDKYTPKSTDKIVLVLSGGGAKGIAHIPVLEMLEKYNIVPDYIVGTSMGALIGGLYASGMSAQELKNLVIKQNFISLFSTYGTSPLPLEDCLDSSRSDLLRVNIDKNFNIVGRSGLIDDLEITSLFNRELFPNGYKKNFDDLPIKFRAVSYNVNKRTRTVHSSGHLMEAMRASMGIPLVFQMYNINNEEHLDGGLVDNIPISVAKELGGNIIITSDVSDKNFDTDISLVKLLVTLVSQINETEFSLVSPDDNSTIYIDHDNSGFDMMSFDKAKGILSRSSNTVSKFEEAFKKLKHPATSVSVKPSRDRELRISKLAIIETGSNKKTEISDTYNNFIYENFRKYIGSYLKYDLFDQIKNDIIKTRKYLDLDTLHYIIEEMNDKSVALIIKFRQRKESKFRLSLLQDIGAFIFKDQRNELQILYEPKFKLNFDTSHNDSGSIFSTFSIGVDRDSSINFGYSATHRELTSPIYVKAKISYGVGDFYMGQKKSSRYFNGMDRNLNVGADIYFEKLNYDISLSFCHQLYIPCANLKDKYSAGGYNITYGKMRFMFFDKQVYSIIRHNQFSIYGEMALGASFLAGKDRESSTFYSANIKVLNYHTISKKIIVGGEFSLYENRFPHFLKTSYSRYSFFNDFFTPKQYISELYSISLSLSYVVEQVLVGDLVFGTKLVFGQCDSAGEQFEMEASEIQNKYSVLGNVFSKLDNSFLIMDFSIGFDTTFLKPVLNIGYDFLNNLYRIFFNL